MLRFKDVLIDYIEDTMLSIKDFAKMIDVTEKQLGRILKGDRLSSDVIRKISICTEIKESYINSIENKYYTGLEIKKELEDRGINKKQFLMKYNISNYENMYNIDIFNKDDEDYLIEDTLRYYEVANITALENKYSVKETSILYKSNKVDKSSLYVWLEYCTKEVRKQIIKEYNKDNVLKLIEYIKQEAFMNRFDANNLINYFNECGVGLVIKDAPKGSKTRGAFRVLRRTPVIFLTTLHKRYADIYFALLHEIAHLKTDYVKAQANYFVNESNDNTEKKADQQALSFMIDEKSFENIKSNILLDINNIENISEFPKMFIIYRMALLNKEIYKTNEYQKYNPLLEG